MKKILPLALLLVSLLANFYLYTDAQEKGVQLQFVEVLYQARNDAARQLIDLAAENFQGLTPEALKHHLEASGIEFRMEADRAIHGGSYFVTSHFTYRFGSTGEFKSVVLNKL